MSLFRIVLEFNRNIKRDVGQYTLAQRRLEEEVVAVVVLEEEEEEEEFT